MGATDMTVSMPKPSGAPTALPKAKPMASTKGTAGTQQHNTVMSAKNFPSTKLHRCCKDQRGNCTSRFLLWGNRDYMADACSGVLHGLHACCAVLHAALASKHTPVTGPVVTPAGQEQHKTQPISLTPQQAGALYSMAALCCAECIGNSNRKWTVTGE
jgi:hypothetical protein